MNFKTLLSIEKLKQSLAKFVIQLVLPEENDKWVQIFFSQSVWFKTLTQAEKILSIIEFDKSLD